MVAQSQNLEFVSLYAIHAFKIENLKVFPKKLIFPNHGVHEYKQ